MARIRSVHPGLFTDEAFVSVSMAARLLLIGLWTESDDNGVFEWNPVKLKMRIFPADDANVAGLLIELKSVNAIEDFEYGKIYGAIRNFRKYQRPKSPKAIHPIPEYIKEYVGLVPQNGEAEPDERPQFPQNGEIPPQMEDGGDKMEEEGRKETTAAGDAPAMSNLPSYFEPSERVFEAMGLDPDDHRMWSQRSRVGEWLNVWSLELDILPTVRRLSANKPPGKIKTLTFFEDAIADAYAARTKPLPTGAANVKPQSSLRASLERRIASLGSSREVCARADDDPGGLVFEGEGA